MHLWVCICVCVCIYLYVHTCGIPRWLLAAILNDSSILFIEGGTLNQTQSLPIWPVLLGNLFCRIPDLPCFGARILGKPRATNIYVDSEDVY